MHVIGDNLIVLKNTHIFRLLWLIPAQALFCVSAFAAVQTLGWASFDEDKDGALSAEEFILMRYAQDVVFDINKDDVWSENEYVFRGQAKKDLKTDFIKRQKAYFKIRDKNKDGVVDLDELLKNIGQQHKRLDKNKDGVLSAAEIPKHLSKIRIQIP